MRDVVDLARRYVPLPFAALAGRIADELLPPIEMAGCSARMLDLVEAAEKAAAGVIDDAEEQARFVADLDAGAVTINGMTTSYNELPFGGTKRSGFGRELGTLGIEEFINKKMIRIG